MSAKKSYLPAGSATIGTIGGILFGWGLARYVDPKCTVASNNNAIAEDTGATTTWILIILGVIMILVAGGSTVYAYTGSTPLAPIRID